MTKAKPKRKAAKKAAAGADIPPRFADHTFGIWSHRTHQVAAYARYSEHHQGFMVYDAQTGRSINKLPCVSLDLLYRLEPSFKPNPAGAVVVTREDRSVAAQERH